MVRISRIEAPGKTADRLSRLLVAVLLLAAMVLSAGVRMVDFQEWRKHPQRAFMHDGRPVLIEFDGYLYLRYARDLIEGSYADHDRLRSYPDGTRRPLPIPLLSLMTAAASRFFNAPVEWAAAWIPVGMAAATVLPFFWMGHLIGGPVGGFAAALTGPLSPFFVSRSQFARFDTDCGIPAFLILIHCLSITVWRSEGGKRWRVVSLLLLTTALFAMWWDNAAEFVLLITALSLIASALFHGKIKLKSGVMILGVLLAGALMLHPDRFGMLGNWTGQLIAILDGKGPVGQSVISEQEIATFEQVTRLGWGSTAVFVGIVFGLAFAFMTASRTTASLLPLLLLAVLPYVWYMRFSIFIAPVLGLGAAGFYVFFRRIHGRKRAVFAKAMGICLPTVLTVSVAVVCVLHTIRRTEWPMVTPYACFAMEEAGKILPQNALIWSWWDNGYHLQYYARRTTIEDGGSFRVPAVTALPLTAVDEAVAANWMHLVSLVGPDRAKACMDSLGRENLLADLAQPGIFMQGHESTLPGLASCMETVNVSGRVESPAPVYLFLNHIYLHTGYWWYWYGRQLSADPLTHGRLDPYYAVALKDKTLSLMEGKGSFDLAAGIIEPGKEAVAQAHVKNNGIVARYSYPRDNDLVFQCDLDSGWAALMDRNMFESVFNRLYFLPRRISPYFHPLVSKPPQFQLWEVSSGRTISEIAWISRANFRRYPDIEP